MALRPLIDYKKQKAIADAAVEEHKPDNEGFQEIQQEEDVEQKPLSAEEAVESFKKEYATKLGWTTKEEWDSKGFNPDNWRDYNHFLNTSPAYIEKLRSTTREQRQRIERNAAAAAAAIEEERRLARLDAEREAREAAAAGDGERAAAAVAKAAQAGPAPETVAWIAQNPWFNEDPEARAVAAAAVERSAKAGATISEQLEAGRNSVKKRFPEYFKENEDYDLPEFITRQSKVPEQQEQQREVRMSESKRVTQAATINGGSRIRETKATKEKGFSDIPQADRDLYEKHFARRFQSRGMNVEEARTKYAKTYWGNKD